MEKERDYYCTSRIASTLMHRQREGQNILLMEASIMSLLQLNVHD